MKAKPNRSRSTPASKTAGEVNPFRAQHLMLAERVLEGFPDARSVTVDEAESPLAWLARRRGRDGKAMIAPHQLLAGERLRTDFTRAHMMPRTTSNWDSSLGSGRRDDTGHRAAEPTEAVVESRQRVSQALDAVGPEFSGLLLDLCCFLKGLEELERDRGWPARSAKVVLQLALDRLARHYGYMAEAKGRADGPIRTWLAEGEAFKVERPA